MGVRQFVKGLPLWDRCKQLLLTGSAPDWCGIGMHAGDFVIAVQSLGFEIVWRTLAGNRRQVPCTTHLQCRRTCVLGMAVAEHARPRYRPGPGMTHRSLSGRRNRKARSKLSSLWPGCSVSSCRLEQWSECVCVGYNGL